MPQLTSPDVRFVEEGRYPAVDMLLAETERPRRPDWVPMTNLWYHQDDTYLGSLSVRHRLSPYMLRAALPVCRQPGIGRALVTCDTTNTASRKVIEANGGEFEDRRGGKLRYWIRTGN
ncbi:GNAT family N-acetyltransferase [Streptomyces sp. NPDC005374]|uniref:GNAT family N-acetyltransferase n=1 Tax=Streptomyces sp. NPDC005374 TaxID=3364713 RepID=UPI0036B97F67